MIHKVFGVNLRRHLELSLRKYVGENPAHDRLVFVATLVLAERRRDGEYRQNCCNKDPTHRKLLLSTNSSFFLKRTIFPDKNFFHILPERARQFESQWERGVIFSVLNRDHR